MMNKIIKIVALVVLAALFASCSKGTSEVQDPQAQGGWGEGVVSFMGSPNSLRTTMTPNTALPLTGYSFKWEVGDPLRIVWKQTLNGVTSTCFLSPTELAKYETATHKQSITKVNADGSASMLFLTPGTGFGGKINGYKPCTMYLLHGVDLTQEPAGAINVDAVYVDISPKPYTTHDATELLDPTKAFKFSVPLRGVFEAPYPLTARPNFIAEHIGSLQIIELENVSAASITGGTIGFTPGITNGKPSRLWYYQKGSKYDVLSEEVVPGTDGDIDPASINLGPSAKIYAMNWVVPRREDNVLTHTDKTFGIGNAVGREAFDLVLNLPGQAVKAVVPLSIRDRLSKPILPGKVYWYRLKWDGQVLILIDIQVLPWDVIEYDVQL